MSHAFAWQNQAKRAREGQFVTGRSVRVRAALLGIGYSPTGEREMLGNRTLIEGYLDDNGAWVIVDPPREIQESWAIVIDANDVDACLYDWNYREEMRSDATNFSAGFIYSQLRLRFIRRLIAEGIDPALCRSQFAVEVTDGWVLAYRFAGGIRKASRTIQQQSTGGTRHART